MKTLNFYCQTRENNFDLLRLIAATLVIFSHAYPLTGNNNAEPLARFCHGFVSFGGLAIACFFIISGYLITAS
ncbi:MAG: acyltransferase family protein, partial [Candidatus Paceibacterales bacterium]